MLKITSDSTIINIHVWTHISLMPLFTQQHIHLWLLQLDSADGTLLLGVQGPTRPSVRAAGPSAPRLLAYF